MHTIRRLCTGATLVAATFLAALSVPPSGSAAAASPGSATVPQVSVAKGAAEWLAGKMTSQGYIPNASPPPAADLSSTVNTILALAAANVALPLARTGLTYMEQNVSAYVTVSEGGDGPGKLALLILAAHALGVDPTNFGGTNLVTRLQATEQTSGPNAGRFGTDAQDTASDAGPYDQGLALQALQAAGVKADGPALSWLANQQCPNGGWVFNTQPDPTNPCNGDPHQFLGPDTNTTAQAVQGLAAQSALTPAMAAGALNFLKNGQNADGGWAFNPAAPDNVQTSDPDSTAFVMEALLALGSAPDGAPFDVGGNTPTGLMLSFKIASGTDAGAFSFPGGGATTGNLIATYQVVPALMGLSFPFGPSGIAYWLAGSDGGIFSFGGAAFHGSMGGTPLNKPVVGIAPALNGGGYWEVASDGGIFNFGTAAFYGSMGGRTLNQPVVGLATGPEGAGYWEVAADGGIFSFGDAGFHGSMGGKPLNKPIVGIAPTPDGGGYWEVASDGGIFSFGDATFHGSTGALQLNQPIVGMAATPDGGGYWLVASDGGLFTFGDGVFSGSATPFGARDVVGAAASAT